MSAPFSHCCPMSFLSLLDVLPGELAPVVHPDSGADHADHECRSKSYGRAKGPTGVAADGGTDESEEFAHTKIDERGAGWGTRLYAADASEYSLAPTHAETKKFTSPMNANVHQSPDDIIPMCMYPDRKTLARIQNSTAA